MTPEQYAALQKAAATKEPTDQCAFERWYINLQRALNDVGYIWNSNMETIVNLARLLLLVEDVARIYTAREFAGTSKSLANLASRADDAIMDLLDFHNQVTDP